MSTTTVIVAVIVVLALQVNAASAEDDDGGSCESDDIISLIRLKDVKHIKKELKDVKDMTKDLRDARTACAANQSIYCSAVNTTSLEVGMRQMKEELLELTREELNCKKNASFSSQQQLRDELKDMKELIQQQPQCGAAVNRSTLEAYLKQLQEDFQDVKTVIQQQSSSVANASSLEEEMKKFREEMVREMRAIIQQQPGCSMNTTSLDEEMRQMREDFQDLRTTCALSQQRSIAVDTSSLSGITSSKIARNLILYLKHHSHGNGIQWYHNNLAATN